MRRAQAAMEFLMSYGWAILVVLVAIGALAYFGVMESEKFVPEMCQSSVPGVPCLDHNVNTTHVSLVISNGIGQTLYINNFTVDGCSGSLSTSIAAENKEVLTIDGCSFTSGDRYSGDFYITYVLGAGLEHSKQGSITSRVD